MKKNKETIIFLGCVSALCLCLGITFATLSGSYLYKKLNLSDTATNTPMPSPSASPTIYPTSTSEATSVPYEEPAEPSDSPLGNLERVSVLPMSYSDDDDEAYEGIAVDIVYYDAYDQVITFENVPIQVDIELYAFQSILDISEISKGTMVYQETVSLDHSPTFAEMFDSYIRIPYTEISIDPEIFIHFGTIKIIVETPHGIFSNSNPLVTLYPEQAEK